ncbi:Glycosyltransferase involved in cell wall bisynthesis [Flavobacterium longum]|uniref:glycosyltransferase n=1 Tax=Flavobacterium longum TaxID=1299340 RepID=UPI0039ED830A
MLAIVIPYYRLRFLEETLQSLAAQTDKRFTVYMGDDASPESPDPVLARFKDAFDFHYKRFNENLGSVSLVRQWERCMAMTRDERWLMILGDDDTLEPDCVASFYARAATIEALNIKVIRFVTRKINASSAPISDLYSHPEIETATDFLIRKYQHRSRSSLSEYIFDQHTAKTKKFRDFPLAWHSDELAVLEFSGFGNVFTLGSVVNVRVSEVSISGKKDNLLVKNSASQRFYIVLLGHIKHFSKAQQQLIFDQAERIYLVNKKAVGYAIKILSYYLLRLELGRVFKFLREIIVTLNHRYAGRQ